MASKEQNGDVQSFPSFLSGSLILDDVSIKNDLSFKFSHEDEIANIAFESFSELKGDEPGKVTSTPLLELKRCTSFEEMLMENHRTILIDSMHDYFHKVQHTFLKSRGIMESPSEDKTTDVQSSIARILSQNPLLQEVVKTKVLKRLKENSDEVVIVVDMLKMCPERIQFEVLLVVFSILEDCDDLIQHFRRKHLGKQLKERSVRLADRVRKWDCLEYLFESEKGRECSEEFETFMEKWMITLFLMKVGVFENQLDNKSIDECLKSDVISKIDLNDLLNQHLIRPTKKLNNQH